MNIGLRLPFFRSFVPLRILDFLSIDDGSSAVDSRLNRVGMCGRSFLPEFIHTEICYES